MSRAAGHAYAFSSLAGSGGAESLFAAHALDLGSPAAGRQSIKFEYLLDYKSGTFGRSASASPTTFRRPRRPDYVAASMTAPIPEPLAWAAMLLGRAGGPLRRGVAAPGEAGHGRDTRIAAARLIEL
jgi:hypothetical protein